MNNDLISRGSLKKEMLFCLNQEITKYKTMRRALGNVGRVAIECVEEVPAVDAVEVVRCKDCLNCGERMAIKYDGFRDDVRLCVMHGIAVLPDDYCSGGVKMMDGGADRDLLP